jgi:predicted DNA-binding ArsR family transcriptional regulator
MDDFKEPNWKEEIEKTYKNGSSKILQVNIYGGKDLAMFDLIADAYKSTDEYKEKKEKLIRMIEAQETIKVKYELGSK